MKSLLIISLLIPPVVLGGSTPNSNLNTPMLAMAADRDQREEVPILDPSNPATALMPICDPQLTVDDIYTGMGWVMVQVETIWNSKGCSGSLKVHPFFFNTYSLSGQTRSAFAGDLRANPVLYAYVNTMGAMTNQLIFTAQQCTLDYPLLMKIIRMSTKMIYNKMVCNLIQSNKNWNQPQWSSTAGPANIGYQYPSMSTALTNYWVNGGSNLPATNGGNVGNTANGSTPPPFSPYY